MNKIFEGEQANDAKDLVNFLIMELHDELNHALKIKDNSNSILNIDQTNRNLVFNQFIKAFVNENKSLISDLFYASNNNITECLNCHCKKYSFQTYFFLIFPLEEVRKYKIQTQIDFFNQNNQYLMQNNQMLYQQNFLIFNNNIQNINTVDLDDCFRYNQKIDQMSGDNSMYCNSCHLQFAARYNTILTTGPEIL